MTDFPHDVLVRIGRILTPFFLGSNIPVRSVTISRSTSEIIISRGGMTPVEPDSLDHIPAANLLIERAKSLVEATTLEGCLVDPRYALGHAESGLRLVRYGEGELRAFSVLARTEEERARIAGLLAEFPNGRNALLWRNPEADGGDSSHRRLENAITERVLGPTIMDRVCLEGLRFGRKFSGLYGRRDGTVSFIWIATPSPTAPPWATTVAEIQVDGTPQIRTPRS